MMEQRPPTHVLVVTVPLRLDDKLHDFNPVEEALRAVVAISRLATEGFVCDDLHVELKEAD